MSKRKSSRKYVEEPMMSEKTLLVTVEDLIAMAMGPPDKNVVNYKTLQMVLHILARQLRMLEQQVELRDDMVLEPMTIAKLTREEKAALKADKREARQSLKPKEGSDRDKEKAERGGAKERERQEMAAGKDKDREDRAASKERERDERYAVKDKEKAEREAEKEKTREEKEKDKVERATSKEREKEREKADRAAVKESERGDKTAAKDKERVEKDRDKAERATAKDAKEQEKADKAAAKERERADKAAGKGTEDAGKLKKLRSPISGASSIEITEAKRGKDKVLVVEKGPTSHADSRSRAGSIEMVTRSQFELLRTIVERLAAKAGPLPKLVLPDNKKLRSELAKGSASLSDTMQAMQVTARVSAAEEAISRMAELLTQLAVTGALPEDVASRVVIGLRESMMNAAEGSRLRPGASTADGRSMAMPHTQRADVRTAEVQQVLVGGGTAAGAGGGGGRKSVAIGAPPARAGAGGARPSLASRGAASAASAASAAASRPSIASRTSAAISAAGLGGPCVSHKEMDDSLQGLREEIAKNIQNMTGKATNNADMAANIAKAVADKLDVALKLDVRISNLHALTSDYAEQLSGFDAGLTTQMQSFQEQMAQMRADLKGGLAVLETANNNAETAAVLELTERYEGLVAELDRTAHAHQSLTTFQKQLGDELRSLVECVEMLREQKADRDEVQDGLRDKADISRLAGLLREEDFADARVELETRLDHCYDKFRKQDSVWLGALRDLSLVTDTKAELLQLMSLRDNTQDQLNEMDEQLHKLADILGDPKAAILTRKLARDATCGVCMVPALMEPQERSYGSPAPLPPLPPLAPRPRPLGQEGPCLAEWTAPDGDLKSHTCKRWVGGSHTLVAEGVTRERAPPPRLHAAPTRRYAGFGTDGQLYMMEEELQPCMECNQLLYEQAAAAEPAELAQPAAPDAKDAKEAGDAPAHDAAPDTGNGAGDQGPRMSQINVEDVQ